MKSAWILFLAAGLARGADASFEKELERVRTEAKAAAEEAKHAVAEAPRPQESAMPRAGCYFQSDKPIMIEILEPRSAAPEAVGVRLHPVDERTVGFSVETVEDARAEYPYPVRLLRVRETAKGRAVLDIFLEVRRGRRLLLFGRASKGGAESFEMDRSLFVRGMELAGQVRFQYTKSLSWGFLGMGGKTLLAISCQVPLEPPQ